MSNSIRVGRKVRVPQPLYTEERLSSPAIPANGRCSSARHLCSDARLSCSTGYHRRTSLSGSFAELYYRTPPSDCSGVFERTSDSESEDLRTPDKQKSTLFTLGDYDLLSIHLRFTCDSPVIGRLSWCLSHTRSLILSLILPHRVFSDTLLSLFLTGYFSASMPAKNVALHKVVLKMWVAPRWFRRWFQRGLVG